MKKTKNGKTLSLIGSILIFIGIILTIFVAGTTKEFFLMVETYSFLGSIISLISIAEYHNLKKANINIDEKREAMYNLNLILVIFVNIPFISIVLYELLKNIAGIF